MFIPTHIRKLTHIRKGYFRSQLPTTVGQLLGNTHWRMPATVSRRTVVTTVTISLTREGIAGHRHVGGAEPCDHQAGGGSRSSPGIVAASVANCWANPYPAASICANSAVVVCRPTTLVRESTDSCACGTSICASSCEALIMNRRICPRQLSETDMRY